MVGLGDLELCLRHAGCDDGSVRRTFWYFCGREENMTATRLGFVVVIAFWCATAMCHAEQDDDFNARNGRSKVLSGIGSCAHHLVDLNLVFSEKNASTSFHGFMSGVCKHGAS